PAPTPVLAPPASSPDPLSQKTSRGAGEGSPDGGSDAGLAEALLALLASPNIASRRPLFEQYDSIVQSRTVRRPQDADAAVLQLPDGSALGVSIDCNGRRVAADPYRGTVEAVLECASNLACVGAEPLGTTNNLNFANPEKPHIAWQLAEAVRGLGDACRALEAPIVGGNVSLYNEGPAGPIYPTPVVGMVGRLPDAARAGRLGWAKEGDAVALVGPFAPALPASELAKLWGRQLPPRLPAIDVGAVRNAQFAVRGAVRVGALSNAHDIAEGGLAIALAECCLAGGLGVEVEIDPAPTGVGDPLLGSEDDPALVGEGDLAAYVSLFGEASGGFLVSGTPSGVRSLGRRTPTRVIGTVGGDSLRIAIGGERIAVTLDALGTAHGALAGLFS
ncbi:MAG: AIR synthase related protein, partial [Solirubrobacterales bacterium]